MSEDTKNQLLRSVNEYGRDILKSIMIINGGAAIASLAFVGNIWSKKGSMIVVDCLAYAILCFCIGVLAAAISSACIFLIDTSDIKPINLTR